MLKIKNQGSSGPGYSQLVAERQEGGIEFRVGAPTGGAFSRSLVLKRNGVERLRDELNAWLDEKAKADPHLVVEGLL